MKKLIKTVLFLISFILINNVYAQTVRIYFYSYGATDHSSNITIDEDIVALKKDGSYYMEYDSRETIKKINSINGEVFTLTKNGVSPTKGSEWYATGKDSKKHYYSQNKKYSVSDIVKELGLGNEDLVEINLHVNWKVKNSSSSNYKIKIKYDINGGKLANKHGDNISVGIFGIIKNKGKDLKSKVAYNKGVNLYNINNPEKINVVREGYYVDLANAWNTKKDGTGISFSQAQTYSSTELLKDSNCDITKKDCEITLYVNWKKSNIKYNINGGKLDDKHGDKISVGFNGIIKKNGKALKSRVINYKYVNLYNIDNPENINVVKKGYYIDPTNAWNTKKDGTGKSFAQSKIYKTRDFCDSSKKDCEITLYINWKRINKVKIKYNINGGKLLSNKNYSLDNNGDIKCNKKKYCQEIDFNSKLSSSGLLNYNNEKYINIASNNEYSIVSPNIWNTKKDGTGISYNQSEAYKASQFCDASKGDCEVTLYANWYSAIKPKLKNNIILSKIADTNIDKSAQSISISDDGLYAYVFMTVKGNNEIPKDAVRVLVYNRTSKDSKFTFDYDTDYLTYDNGIENGIYVMHANGSTYYKDGNDEYLFVTTKVNGNTSNYVLKYKINDKKLEYNGIFTFKHKVSGITFNKENNCFYLSYSGEVNRYNKNFADRVIIRSAKDRYYYGNQDITYYKNNLYSIARIPKDSVNSISNGLQIPLKAYYNVITIIDANNGDFVRYLVFPHSDVKKYINGVTDVFSKKGISVNEIEDLVFIDDTPYYFVQTDGNIVLINSDKIQLPKIV